MEAVRREAPPMLSAVVVNYNGGKRVLRCVESIRRHGGMVEEIILVDNGSQDGSAEAVMAAFPETRLIRLSDNPGPAVARNRGLVAARGRLVLLADADTRLTERALELLLQTQSATGAAIVCPRLILAPGTGTVQCDGAAPHFVGTLILRNANAAPDIGGPPRDVGGIISACLLVDRAAALDAGGFNETFFFYFEDLEFGLRMRLLGHRIVCAPRAVVIHDRGTGYAGLSFRGTGNYPRQRAYLSMRNRLLTIAICFHWRTILVIAPALLLYELATLVLALMRGWLPLWARGWVWMFTHGREVRQMRRSMQARRKLRDSEVLAGSPLPLAQGLFKSRMLTVATEAFSRLLAAYWRLARVAAY
ncbi:glycosyltransferase family 2 protein [Tropicimonas aquimaris]|uniref:Glycosyltransferase family 2 protein n=1 Tax=Tropicimonas aquimaris TaxID=914152 RepID=A0ABW3IYU3_9RHOB